MLAGADGRPDPEIPEVVIAAAEYLLPNLLKEAGLAQSTSEARRLITQGGVRIDGEFEGSIKTPGKVLVSQGGKMKAEIDAGTITVEGQVEGGISMGVGMALQEEMLFDGDGVHVNPNLTNYIMPTSLDMPHIDVDIVENFDPTGPFGAKGVGEPPMGAGGAALMSAIADALGGHLFNRTPVTPDMIVNAASGRLQSHRPLEVFTA